MYASGGGIRVDECYCWRNKGGCTLVVEGISMDVC